MNISLKDIKIFIFDFDGVLTNNLVHLDSQGNEWVSCNRSDGLAFDALRKLNQTVYILSSEKNQVVKARANKLQIPVIQGIEDKSKSIKELAARENFNLDKVLYLGNDLNDYHAMKLCGFTACPSDSHKKIISISDIVLKEPGGNGVVRELLEEVLELILLKILYNK